jgi:hypothetical protein
MRTGSSVYLFDLFENWTGCLIGLRSGSQSSLYHLLVPLVLLLTWDCYSSPVAITFFSHTAIPFLPLYSSLFITITLLFTANTVLPLLLFSLYWYYSSLYYYYFFPIALILFLLLLLFSHGVAL